MISAAERRRFDELFDEVMRGVPPSVRAFLEEIPVVIDDRPDPALVESLRQDGTIAPDEDGSDLCGLHSGVALTDRSVEDGAALPDQVYLFREGIVALALDQVEDELGERPLGWVGSDVEEIVREEIRVTLLHEIGHHVGLEEDDLEELGYD